MADLDLMDNDNYKLGLITNNGTMDFNIAARQAEDGLLLNIWKNVQGDGNYTITVGDRQVSGKYQLIGDAANFDKTITVKTESGQTKGELYLGMEKAVNCNGVKLLLKLDEETNVVYVAVNSNYSKGTDREKQETELELPKDAFDTFAQPTYTITKGPDWLEINEYTGDFTGKTGKISGTATGYGDTEVIVKAMENGETAEHHIDMVVVPEEIEGAENLEIDDDDLAEEIGPTKSMTDLIAEAVKNRDNHFEFSWAFDPIYWKWMDCQFYLDRSKISVAVTDTEYSVTIQCELRMSGLLPRKLLGDDVVIKADLFGEDYFKLTVARDFSKLSAELVGTITIENIDIANGLFTLESAELSVKRDENDPDKQILTGKVDKLRFAHFGGALSGDLTLVDGAIDRIVISVSDINYPFVPAGWFLTSIGAGVENLQSEDPDKPVTMIGKAGFRYGAEVRLDLIEPFTFFNGTFSIASMKFEGRINENGIRGDVNVTIAGGVITGNASAELDWTYNTFQLKGGFNVLERTFVNAAFKIDGEGNFTFAGTAMVDFSAWNYSVLGSLKAEGGVVVSFTNDGNMGNDYAMLWGGVVLCGRHVTLGGRVYFNGKMEWIGNKELQEVEQEVTTRAGATSGSWNLANDEGIVLLVADWEDGTAEADVRLTDAEGNTYSLADLKDIAGIELVDELSTATHKVIALDNPKAGVWSLSVDGVEDAKITASIIDEALALDAPALDISLNENRELTLSWDNSLLFDGERVSIFYDNDAAGYDGCLIASLNSDDLMSGSYTWTMPNLYSGTFNFYVMVDADNAIPVFSEYSKSITVQASLEEVDFDVDSTYIYVDTGYTITGRTIANGVTVIVNGGIVNGIILEDGASLRMYGDSVLKGAITIDGGANVVEKGHLAGEDVDLHLVMPEKVNENAFISSMETWDVSSLTITIGDAMELGRYLLATDGGARGISATLTSADGTSLGTVSTNTSIRHDDRTFSLETDSDKRLYLAVQDSASPHVTADITTPTAGNVTVTAEYDDDCVTKEYSLDGETWKKYSKPLVVKENGSLYFRGKYQDGTYTTITRYDVTNIDRVAPEAPTVKADVTALTNKPVTVTATFSSDSVKKEYSLDGTTWRDYTAGIVFNDNGAVYFRGKDAAGNVSEIVRYDVTNIDVMPPATPVVTASETKPTNGDVTVSAVFSDDSVKKEYSLDGVTWMDYAQAVVFNENGSVLFRGTDAVGNVSEIVTYIVSNIDKTAPAKPVLTADITETTDGNVTVTAAFDADTSYAEYRIDGGDWIRYGGGVVMSRNGKVAIRAVDTAGNVSDIVEYIVSNIEKIGPVISMGGKLEVSSGDVVDYAVISSGGSIVVSNGGTANQTAVKTDGELWIYDSGIANYTTVSAGGNLIALDGGVANEATVKTDGWMVVAYEGVANSTHISSGGILAVRVGGTASETIIYSSGYLDVSSGGTADETTVSQGGRLWVWSGGNANSTTVSAYGGAIVKNMGNVSFTDVSANGYLAVSNGGTAVSTTVNQMGQMFVSEGGTAIYNQIAGSMYGYNGYDARIDVFNGGRVISTVISSGGELIVSNGGTASDVIVNGKGALFVINGGTALRVKENGGAVFVNPGANVTFVPNVISNIDFGLEDSFEITLHSGTTAMSATHTNGFLEIYSGGMADSINDESVMMVYDGGLAKSTTVGYELHISSGGTAIMTVVSGGSMNVSNGGVANQTTVNRGSVMVEEGGSAVSTTIHSGGAMAVSFGGTATSTTVNASGSLSVSDEAVVKATTVDGSMGRFFVSSGGTATSTTVASGGSVVVSNSGTLSSTTIATSGKLIVSNGGTAKDLILYNGGSMVVYSGGILKGSVMLAGMMTLSGTVDASNASITFDVSQRTENSSVLIANFNHIDTAEYFVTVAANQTEGQYRLAGNAADFNGSMTLTVKDTNLTTRLSRDTVATVGRKDYSLVVNSGILWLTVTGEGIPAPINLSNTNNELLWTSVEEVTGYFIEYSRDGFKTVITVETETVGMEQYNVGVGTWQWRVKAKEGAEWAVGNDITISSSGTSTTVVSATEDGVTDAFFGRALDTWNGNYQAEHVGVGEWNGTEEVVALNGKNQITDIFAGSDDASILLLTDDENGDALFIDDIYSAFPEGLDAQARIANIDEIRAGDGNDIVDLTSQRFDYVGGGMTVKGGLGDDVIWANSGNNTLFGDAGNDRIVGAGGNDVIVGGSGDDSLHGGGGEDIFAFGGDWGNDSVEQLANGMVTLWFDNGSLDKWDASTLTYRDGDKSVKVSGVGQESITLKFGDDGSEQYGRLLEAGGFDEFSSERIFENKNTRGLLA
ncbi:MAG: AIDA repeat-containing protein [Lentisphaeria bacterium]|nr:AIDA repeat-containing protein [Lentisphaeria bacterium]